jgi:hypothetical protein
LHPTEVYPRTASLILTKLPTYTGPRHLRLRAAPKGAGRLHTTLSRSSLKIRSLGSCGRCFRTWVSSSKGEKADPSHTSDRGHIKTPTQQIPSYRKRKSQERGRAPGPGIRSSEAVDLRMPQAMNRRTCLGLHHLESRLWLRTSDPAPDLSGLDQIL